ncbi:type IVB secretion system protein IcmG/DotF [Legionella septentrionalis]|uniref:type IVB secretion system protein IcmG/DotF n=1 Tax=Legionella septentrionalis TaxID=2498109 RepID=UPI000F8D2FAB|nr:type IVB secretion system protein IcmG/DotF [Legionella septentrionalis]RUR10373.1 type IV secretion protein IcmG [Legionella septentrionalis]
MADTGGPNDQYKDQYNDEYQFNDLDALTPEGQETVTEETTVSKRRNLAGTNIRRNALIVVGLVVLAMVIYKFLGSYFSERRLPVKTVTAVTPITPKPTPAPQSIAPTPVIQPAMPPTQTVDPQTEQKLSALEVSQQNMRSEVASISNQLGGINSNVNTLANQITQLNQTLAALNAKIDAQAHEIEKLMAYARPKKVHPVVRKITTAPKYYIQAVIPGRAWLIAQNGATLTVREGTVVPGYGTVKFIDPLQGRIITSSGQIIRFSQDDS